MLRTRREAPEIAFVRRGRVGLDDVRDCVRRAWGGGFPIKGNGEIVGAIGVRGAPAVQNDVDCARAALALVPGASAPTE